MQIEPPVRNLRRTVSRPIAVGIVTLVIVLSIAACDFVDDALPLPTQTVAPQQVSKPTSTMIPELVAKVTNSEPPTPTVIPVELVEAAKLPPTHTAVPTALSTHTVVPTALPTHTPLPTSTLLPAPTSTASSALPTATIAATEGASFYEPYVIGHSSREFPLTAHQFNSGPHHIIVVGGIHGGYEWNTILLAYEMIYYFQNNPEAVPDSVTLTIIPAANPDGLERVSGKIGYFTEADLDEDTQPGRFNGNEVDLNRNWDCMWQSTGVWRGREVSGGTEAFSEPETKILSGFFLQHRPDAVIFLHSALNGVIASGCPDTYQPSMDLAQIYGTAAGYPVYESFPAYEVTGDAGDWLSMQGIASISVELINHENLDLRKNLAGMLAVLEQYK